MSEDKYPELFSVLVPNNKLSNKTEMLKKTRKTKYTYYQFISDDPLHCSHHITVAEVQFSPVLSTFC
jgi:hypothetical protein